MASIVRLANEISLKSADNEANKSMFLSNKQMELLIQEFRTKPEMFSKLFAGVFNEAAKSCRSKKTKKLRTEQISSDSSEGKGSESDDDENSSDEEDDEDGDDGDDDCSVTETVQDVSGAMEVETETERKMMRNLFI